MNILHLNTMDVGGAAIAVIRLHEGLLAQGYNSNLLVRSERRLGIPKKYILQEPPETIHFVDRIKIRLGLRSPHSFYDQQGMRLEGAKLGYGFSFPQSLADITTHETYAQADIIHLHWIGKLLDFRSFFQKNTKPIVWTLHDFNPFSGGLHYPIGTDYNAEQLLKPIPNPQTPFDFLLNENISLKLNALEKVQKMTVVSTSDYMYRYAQQSTVLGRFDHQIVSLGLDTSVFRPYDQAFCRQVFGLSPNRKTLIFSATNSAVYKGLPLLLKVLKNIQQKLDFQLFAVGLLDQELLAQFPDVHFSGMIHDERLMAMAYSAADVLVNPSLQEAFGQTTAEALACGVPVVSFPTGGALELIIAGKNGFLCPDFSEKALETSLLRFITDPLAWDNQKISEQAAEKLNLSKMVRQYVGLYAKLLDH